MTELKTNIETLAKEAGKTELEIISMLQAAAAEIEDNETLEALCEIKWDYI
jgi:predicted negative regulator of RcsB-dependent stress response